MQLLLLSVSTFPLPIYNGFCVFVVPVCWPVGVLLAAPQTSTFKAHF